MSEMYTPLLEDDGGYDYEDQIIQERNSQARGLADDMLQLKSAMDDLRGLVDEQGVMLNEANDNVIRADLDVEDGVGELEEAYVYKTRSRKKQVCIAILVLLVLAVVVVIILYSTGVIKKK
ncbi:putative t-SNARE family protein [Tieghemostelium lacteum]|uniref:Putative t-SNARE family protein n=1 Tax=Tieghemostelium lacteum TaxID=361077 RepID=A0A151ZH15_TIELA|nr:putative t-SNARE family protein [Tieghemostelium lacteum]|eukprot:KYQ93271.1 putative t-SNARE family protein [Tieghemostelium lacteum]